MSFPIGVYFRYSQYSVAYLLPIVNVQCDELESFLETLMDQEFDTIVDDGSTPEVSHMIQHPTACGSCDPVRGIYMLYVIIYNTL